MLLILYARYVNEDIALHYGRLPPSFLPLGNRRLFSWQAELAESDNVFLTVPDDLELSEVDRIEIERLNIQLLSQDSSLSLTEAIRNAVIASAPSQPLRLLYGDTLVRRSDTVSVGESADTVVVHHTTSNYPWAYVVDGKFSDETPKKLGERRVVCGDFIFADPELLISV